MVCCKLDKIDKIFISVLCIFVTFICVFNTFCFADTKITGTPIYDLNYTNGVFVENEGSLTYYFKLVPGHTYTFYNTLTYNRTIRFSDTMPAVGVESVFSTNVNGNETYSFTAKDNYLFVSDIATSGNTAIMDNYLVDTTNGFTSTILLLFNNVGVNNIFKVFENITPYLLVAVTVSLGFYFILHAIKEVSKGRDI